MLHSHSSMTIDDIRVLVQAIRNWSDDVSVEEIAALRRELSAVIDYALPMFEQDVVASGILYIAYSLLALNHISSALQNVENVVLLREHANDRYVEKRLTEY